MRDLKTPIAFVGPLPPPVTGRILATEFVRQRFADHFALVVTANIAPPAQAEGGIRKLGRVPRLLAVFPLLVLARIKGARVVYQVVDGDAGMYHTILCVLLARLLCMRAVLHHHNWNYFENAQQRMQWLVRCAGATALHVVLCQRMADLGRRWYGPTGDYCVLSNAILVQDQRITDAGPAESLPLRLGHMSNLSIEKGLERALETFRHCRELGMAVELCLAGPPAGERERIMVDQAVAAGGVRYLGPVYGERKRRFFSEIDLFLFPSLYRNEAEPLVCMEALSAGVPVMAYDVGCCSGLLGAGDWTFARHEPFASSAARLLHQLERGALRQLARDARLRYQALQESSSRQFKDLVAKMGKRT